MKCRIFAMTDRRDAIRFCGCRRPNAGRLALPRAAGHIARLAMALQVADVAGNGLPALDSPCVLAGDARAHVGVVDCDDFLPHPPTVFAIHTRAIYLVRPMSAQKNRALEGPGLRIVSVGALAITSRGEELHAGGRGSGRIGNDSPNCSVATLCKAQCRRTTRQQACQPCNTGKRWQITRERCGVRALRNVAGSKSSNAARWRQENRETPGRARRS